MASYLYNISSFPNLRVNIDSLTNEIKESSIVSVFQYINGGGPTDGVGIFFATSLSGGDLTTLNNIIATHQGNPPVDAGSVTIDGYLTIKTQDSSISDGNLRLAAIDASGRIVNPLVSPVYFGQHFEYAESLGASTSSALTPQTKVTLTTSNLLTGKYRIYSSWLFSHSNVNNSAIFDVKLNGSTILNQQINVEFKDTLNIYALSVVSYKNLTGVNTIILQFWNTGTSTTISDAVIELTRVS